MNREIYFQFILPGGVSLPAKYNLYFENNLRTQENTGKPGSWGDDNRPSQGFFKGRLIYLLHAFSLSLAWVVSTFLGMYT